MSSSFGNTIKTTVFGQSHGVAIGVLIENLPVGEVVDMDELNAFLSRRKPGKNALSTARKEEDEPIFLSGFENGKIIDSPLCAIIYNKDTRSKDYTQLLKLPRPGHADYTAYVKWAGKADMRGGGHFSGRLTAPLCIAGGIAKQILARKGIYVGAHLLNVAGIRDDEFPMLPSNKLFVDVANKAFPVINDDAGEAMQKAILDAKKDGDSVGGIIQCSVIGLPVGLGAPMFDGVENCLAKALFAIPAVKGLEFGQGFNVANLRGYDNNDPFELDDGNNIKTFTNNCGGILGGITNGMPVQFNLAVKPTPSIAKAQQTVNLENNKVENLEITGRHDPCIAPRAVPVVEAVTALVILDLILEA